MEITYMMIGVDGQQYGPITLEQLKTWISERRVTPETNILRSDTNSWLPAAQYTELELGQPVAVAAPAAAMPRPAAMPRTAPLNTSGLERQIKSGAGWFYFIAALSLVNSIAAVSGSNWRFVIGLGITQIFDVMGTQWSHSGTTVSLVLDTIVVGIFVVVGVFSHKRQAWAFIVGMVLYGLDCGLLLYLGIYDWLSIVFHVFALFSIFLGLRASIRLKALQMGTAQ